VSLPAGATTDPATLDAARTDRSGATGAPPRGVVRARDVAEVREVAAWAHAQRVPLVVRGAGSGLAGGAIADGALVLDLGALDRIVAIDPVDEIAVVEPGVVTADLDAAARQHGLFFAPDPASAALSTVGGNVATNAGGLRCVKYGVTRDAVLALDVVLADGRLIRTGRRTVKGVAGYDLTALLVGSEGTLGIVVGATVRLRPVPEQVVTLAADFATTDDAAQACVALQAARLTPSMLELLDDATLDVIDRAQGTTLRGGATGALVIAQFDGLAADRELARALEVLEPRATRVRHATDPEDAAALLAARRLALPSIERFGPALIEDIVVPRSQLATAFARLRGIRQDLGVDLYAFAHAGDGNVHPILSYDPSLDAPPPAVAEAADRIFALALQLGGTVTGEHGVGTLKRDWLAHEQGDDVLALHAAVKRAFDPHDVLNPGKAI